MNNTLQDNKLTTMLIQNNLNLDIDTCKKILLLFHPDIPDITDDTMKKLCHNGSYDWVAIEGNIPKYGRVSLMIDNSRDPSFLIGEGHTINTFNERQSQLVFDIWRTVLDVKYESTHTDVWDSKLNTFINERYLLRPKYTEILTEAGYTTKTAQEWFEEYYKD